MDRHGSDVCCAVKSYRTIWCNSSLLETRLVLYKNAKSCLVLLFSVRFTAIMLLRNGHKNVVVVGKHIPGDMSHEYTSPWAGASVLR
ncbi:hypothetical protein F4703DRAFT_1882942 [Phycomyces blakesleeanus]